jgi:hypothetical protein
MQYASTYFLFAGRWVEIATRLYTGQRILFRRSLRRPFCLVHRLGRLRVHGPGNEALPGLKGPLAPGLEAVRGHSASFFRISWVRSGAGDPSSLCGVQPELFAKVNAEKLVRPVASDIAP